MPQRPVAEKHSRVVERQALEMKRKNDSYQLVDSDSDDENYPVPSKVKTCSTLNILLTRLKQSRITYFNKKKFSNPILYCFQKSKSEKKKQYRKKQESSSESSSDEIK